MNKDNNGSATFAEPTSITFSPEQQERINRIVEDRLSRSNRELKEQLEELRGQKAALEGRSSGEGNTDAEIQRLSGELDNAQGEVEALRKRSAIQDALRNIAFHDPAEVAEAIESRVRFDKALGRHVILNPSGVPTLNNALEPMTVDEYVRDYAARKPWTIRSKEDGAVKSDSRSDASTAKRIFGKNSDGNLANKLAQKNIAEYRRLKAIARELKVI